jgi:hypothetical protein
MWQPVVLEMLRAFAIVGIAALSTVVIGVSGYIMAILPARKL